MQVKWVIENFTNSADYRELHQAVLDTGRKSQLVGYRVGDGDHLINVDDHRGDPCLLVHGSIQFTRAAKEKLGPLGHKPIAYCTDGNYTCSAYYKYFTDFLFNDKHEFIPLGELKDQVFDTFRRYGKEALVWIRPDGGDKPFSGGLVDLLDFDKFWNNAVRTISINDPVIVSTPKTVNGEWRFVVTRGEIIACSTYQYQGQRTEISAAPVGATELVKQLMKVAYYPDPVFCYDVCEDADGKFWMLELTSFSSAGLYACNKKAIAEKVSAIAEKE